MFFGKKQPVFRSRQKQNAKNATPEANEDTSRIHRSAQPETNFVMAVEKRPFSDQMPQCPSVEEGRG